MNSIDFNNLLNLPAIIIIPFVLNAIGWMLKRWPLFPDKLIPIALTVLGPLMYCGWQWQAWTPRDVIIGIFCGPLAVGFHQYIKQYKMDNDDEAF
jgi:hypothetical protein